MEINGLNLTRLRNLAHFEFCTEVKKMVSKHTAEKLNVVEAFNEFCLQLAEEEKGLELVRQHKLTAKITALDTERDEVFSGLVANCKSLTKHFDANIRKTAEKIIIVLENYGNLATENYNEETAGLHKLCEELLGNHSEELSSCNLTDWVKNLQQLNEEFRKLMLSRNEDMASQEPIHLRSVRKQVDKYYRLMVKRVEASALLNGEENFKDFIGELNGRIEYYKEHNIHRNDILTPSPSPKERGDGTDE